MEQVWRWQEENLALVESNFVLKDEQGQITINRGEVIKVAEEFYRNLCSSDGRQTEDPSMETMNIEVPGVSTSKINKALRGRSSHKTGEDGLSIHLIKDSSDFSSDKLAVLFAKCLQNCTVPNTWKNGEIILIHKKDNIKDLKIYGLTSLLSIVYKLITKVFPNWISAMLDSNQTRKQAGFCTDCPTTEHILVIHQGVWKYAEYAKSLCMAFIDYAKAFDSLETSLAMKTLRRHRAEEIYVKI